MNLVSFSNATISNKPSELLSTIDNFLEYDWPELTDGVKTPAVDRDQSKSLPSSYLSVKFVYEHEEKSSPHADPIMSILISSSK